MPTLRLVRGSECPESQDIPRRRASDREAEERFRYPAEEVWEVSCRSEERRDPSGTSPETRAS